MNRAAKIAIVCAAVMAAAGLIWFVLCLYNSNQTEYIPVAEEVTVAETEPETEEVTIPLYDYVPSETGMTEKAKQLIKINKDTVGWIKIPNTKVDYPIVRDPGEIPEGVSYYGNKAYKPNYYYLNHDYYRNDSREGTIYCDYRDNFGGAEEYQSENMVLYGHNMANNNMFGSIRRYRQDYSFYEQAPFIELSSNYADYDYVIFGFLVTSGNWYGDFIYWDMEELDNKEDFDFYINKVHEKQMIDTGIDVKYGDKLLTLSTCYADEDNSRFIVVARRLRDGEIPGDLSSIEKTEAYKKAHSEQSKTD